MRLCLQARRRSLKRVFNYRGLSGVTFRNFLQTWTDWQAYCNAHEIPSLRPSVQIKVVVSGFVLYFLTNAIQEKTNSIWWMIGLFEKLFDSILKENVSEITRLIHDAFAEREPLVNFVNLQAHPDEQLSSPTALKTDMFDEYGVPTYRNDSQEAIMAKRVTILLCIKYLVELMTHFVERMKEKVQLSLELSSSVEFMEDLLIRTMFSCLVTMETKVRYDWNRMQLMTDKIPCYLVDTNFTPLWNLLCRITFATRNAAVLLNNMDVTSHYIGTDAISEADNLLEGEDEEKGGKMTDVVYSANKAIFSFCINSRNSDELALLTEDFVGEISIEASQQFFGVLRLNTARRCFDER
jgi:hypothetical protein